MNFRFLMVIMLTFLMVTECFAAHLKHSQQLLLVLTNNTSTFQGIIQKFIRDDHNFWILKDDPIPIVIGQKGMASNKVEGDLRTPMGIYPIGPLFGFDVDQPLNTNMPYIPLRDDTVCVDDVLSKFYNQIINSDDIYNPDWNSAEPMRAISLYQIGSFVQYNQNPTVANKGSCIFMHIWRSPSKGTAGCVAMDEKDLRSVLQWLDPDKKPMIVIISKDLYKTVEKDWDLPPQAEWMIK